MHGRENRSRSKERETPSPTPTTPNRAPPGALVGMDMVTAIGEALRAYKVATTPDLDKITAQVAEISTQVKSHGEELHRHADELQKLHGLVADLQVKFVKNQATPVESLAGSVASGSTAPTDRNYWTGAATARTPPSNSLPTHFVPGKVIIRGFAPNGCAPQKKLDRIEYKQAFEELVALLPTHLAAAVTMAPAFALNWQIELRLVRPSRASADLVVQHLRSAVERANFKIKGAELKISCEISELRREQCRGFFAAEERLKAKVGEGKYEICHRSLKLYDKDTRHLLGEVPRDATNWVWTELGQETVGAANTTMEDA